MTKTAPMIPTAKVESSNIAEIGYHFETQTLRIKFLSGGTYDYANVTQKLYNSLKNSASIGSFFYKHIKGAIHHPFTKID